MVIDAGTWKIIGGDRAGHQATAGAQALNVVSSICIQMRPRLTRMATSDRIRLQWQLHPILGKNSFGCNRTTSWIAQPEYRPTPAFITPHQALIANWTISLTIRSWQDPYILGQQPSPRGSDTLSDEDFNVLGGCLLAVTLVLCVQPVLVAKFLHDKYVEESTPPVSGWSVAAGSDSENDFRGATPSSSRANGELDASSTVRGGRSIEELAFARVRALELRSRQ